MCGGRRSQPRGRATRSPQPTVTRASSLCAALRCSEPHPPACTRPWAVPRSQQSVDGGRLPKGLGLGMGSPGPSSDAGGYLSIPLPLPPSLLTTWDACPQRLHRAQPRTSDIWGQVRLHVCDRERITNVMGEGVPGTKGSPAFHNSQITPQTPGKFEITIILWSDLLKQ